MKSKIKIGLVAVQNIVHQGLVSLLNDEKNVKLQFDVSTLSEVLKALQKERVDVLLIDLEWPFNDGKEVLKSVLEKYPNISVIMFSSCQEAALISDCILLGVKGFLIKNCEYNKLLNAIYSIFENEYYFDEEVYKILFDDVIDQLKATDISHSQNLLTTREKEIIVLICNGYKNKEMAKQLYISNRTVEGHRIKITEKTGVKNVVELVLYAIKHEIYRVE